MEIKNGSKILAVAGAGVGVLAAYKFKPSVTNYVLFGAIGLVGGYLLGKKLEPVTAKETTPGQVVAGGDVAAGPGKQSPSTALDEKGANQVASQIYQLMNARPSSVTAAADRDKQVEALKAKLSASGWHYSDGKAVRFTK